MGGIGEKSLTKAITYEQVGISINIDNAANKRSVAHMFQSIACNVSSPYMCKTNSHKQIGSVALLPLTIHVVYTADLIDNL